MKIGIVICSRSSSSRLPRKPWIDLGDKPLLCRLLDNINDLGLPICVAVPDADSMEYRAALTAYPDLHFFSGEASSPLHRMTAAADRELGWDAVVRITHDKVFVDGAALREALTLFEAGSIDYLYSSYLIDGTGFEIIRTSTLIAAAAYFRDYDIEHVYYGVRDVLDPHRICNYKPTAPRVGLGKLRLLVDYPEDVMLLRYLISRGGFDLRSVLATIERYPYLAQINTQTLPLITVYTSAYNAEATITETITSVYQSCSGLGTNEIEYIVIDDGSTDNTAQQIIESPYYVRLKFVRNDSNLGLAASSNVALNMARGRYIMRIDADDILMFADSLRSLVDEIELRNLDVLYPMYLDQELGRCLGGALYHHVGGCIFLRSALQRVQFTNGLQSYDGLDLYARAKLQLTIGYTNTKPHFYYRASTNSLSRRNPDVRARIRDLIELGITGPELLREAVA